MDRKWVAAYTRNKNHSDQYRFEDGSWVYFMKEVEDTRDIMSDCVRPSWGATGNYEIGLVPAGKHHGSDHDFLITCDKGWANRIVYNLQHGKFHTAEELKKAVKAIGEQRGTYQKCYNICQGMVTLKGEN